MPYVRDRRIIPLDTEFCVILAQLHMLHVQAAGASAALSNKTIMSLLPLRQPVTIGSTNPGL